jgi:hypothetical protein
MMLVPSVEAEAFPSPASVPSLQISEDKKVRTHQVTKVNEGDEKRWRVSDLRTKDKELGWRVKWHESGLWKLGSLESLS